MSHTPTDTQAMAKEFRRLHQPGAPLLMPNARDAGSAWSLASLGFAADLAESAMPLPDANTLMARRTR